MFSNKKYEVWLDIYLIIYWTITTVGYIFFNEHLTKFTISLALLGTLMWVIKWLMDDVQEALQQKLDKLKEEQRNGQKNNQ